MASLLEESGVRARRIQVGLIASPGADTSGIVFGFDAPNGRMEGVMLYVDRGRRATSVTVLERADKVEPSDVLPLHETLRDRLAA